MSVLKSPDQMDLILMTATVLLGSIYYLIFGDLHIGTTFIYGR